VFPSFATISYPVKAKYLFNIFTTSAERSFAPDQLREDARMDAAAVGHVRFAHPLR
jgi:hypothetical protein